MQLLLLLTRKSTQYWSPKKRLTRHQMDHLRTLRRDFPDEWDIKKLGAQFGISYMAVKRILRSKFEPSEEVKQRQDKKAIENREKRKELSKNKQ